MVSSMQAATQTTNGTGSNSESLPTQASETGNDNKPMKRYCIYNSGKPNIKLYQEVRSLIQNVLQQSVNLCTLIGSGASLPAIPLMKTIFKTLRNNVLNPKDVAYLDKIIHQIHPDIKKVSEYSDIEDLLSHLKFRIDGKATSEKRDKKLYDKLIEGFISQIYKAELNSQQYKDTLNWYSEVIGGLGKSRQILTRQQKTTFDIVNLFTTNYDLFHEEALKRKGYSYTDGFTNGLYNDFSEREFHRRPIDLDDRFRDHFDPINPFFRLIKLHGSVDWRRMDHNNGEPSFIRLPYSEAISEMRKAIKSKNKQHRQKPKHNGYENVMISPTKSKYALTQEAPYADLFREFVNCLATPNTVLFVVGFGFGDDHISHLIENALDRSDFMLYAFVPEQKLWGQGLHEFYNHIQSFANAYFISPSDEKGQNNKSNTNAKNADDQHNNSTENLSNKNHQVSKSNKDKKNITGNKNCEYKDEDKGQLTFQEFASFFRTDLNENNQTTDSNNEVANEEY